MLKFNFNLIKFNFAGIANRIEFKSHVVQFGKPSDVLYNHELSIDTSFTNELDIRFNCCADFGSRKQLLHLRAES